MLLTQRHQRVLLHCHRRLSPAAPLPYGTARGWTVATLGQPRMQELAYEHACEEHPLRWPNKYALMRCRSFYRDLVNMKITTGPEAGRVAWDVLTERLVTQGDLQNRSYANELPKLWFLTDNLVRRLRAERFGPEAIIDITCAGNPSSPWLRYSDLWQPSWHTA